jgi:hypothetical protein
MRNLLASYLAALLIMACAKAHFVHETDGGAAGGADGGGGPVGGSSGGAGDNGGGGSAGAAGATGGALCQLTRQTCSGERTTDPCDPVCQSGACPCDEKCTFAGTSPHVVCAAKGPNQEFESCTATYYGQDKQFDNCAAGNICLGASYGDDPNTCFKLCYDKSDCYSGTDCGKRQLASLDGFVFVCDPLYTPCGPDTNCCNPLADTSNGCAAPTPVCFLVSPDPTGHSRTVCEYSPGSGQDPSAPCDSSHDCMPKFTCAEHFCHQVCNPAESGQCPVGTICKLWGIEYGYCTAN